jgi:transposase-like protein
VYYRWSKDFLEAGKRRLQDDTIREANSEEVNNLRKENNQLKHIIADLFLKNRIIKKSTWIGQLIGRYMRNNQSEKTEIIRMVAESQLSVKRTFEELDVPRSTFYSWYKNYQKNGIDGLKDHWNGAKRFWNRIPDTEKEKVVQLALEYPEKSPRELAWFITDTEGYFISDPVYIVF